MNSNTEQHFPFTKEWEAQMRSIPHLANRLRALEARIGRLELDNGMRDHLPEEKKNLASPH